MRKRHVRILTLCGAYFREYVRVTVVVGEVSYCERPDICIYIYILVLRKVSKRNAYVNDKDVDSFYTLSADKESHA